MAEIRKARVYKSEIERGYTFQIGLRIFRKDEDVEQYIQGFGGKKLYDDNDYNFWRNAVENVLGRKVEDGEGTIIKTAITDEDILGIANFKENYWIVQEKVIDKDGTPSRAISIKQNKTDIKDFFEKNGIEYKGREDEGKDESLR